MLVQVHKRPTELDTPSSRIREDVELRNKWVKFDTIAQCSNTLDIEHAA
jgi:hypothetical protein